MRLDMIHEMTEKELAKSRAAIRYWLDLGVSDGLAIRLVKQDVLSVEALSGKTYNGLTGYWWDAPKLKLQLLEWMEKNELKFREPSADSEDRDERSEAIGNYWRNMGMTNIRVIHTMINERIKDLDDLCSRVDVELLRVPNFGRKSLDDMRRVLHKHGRDIIIKSSARSEVPFNFPDWQKNYAAALKVAGWRCIPPKQEVDEDVT